VLEGHRDPGLRAPGADREGHRGPGRRRVRRPAGGVDRRNLGTPDYNYDQFSGITYDIDITQPTGSRIVNYAYKGTAIADTQQFVVAVNNYRQSGGGGFPYINAAPVVYNAQVSIREAIVAYAAAAGTIDPTTFWDVNWRLVRNAIPVF
jgi:2',3'-cyclic-nucleotide 2'-phosphodiesterase/3'-nucleotidase